MRNLAFLAVCNFFGSQAKTAKIVGCTPSFVGHVVQGRRPIPVEWAPIIERESGGKFTCEELIPNFPWGVLRKSAVSEKVNGPVQKN